jgi:hypothetical protein
MIFRRRAESPLWAKDDCIVRLSEAEMWKIQRLAHFRNDPKMEAEVPNHKISDLDDYEAHLKGLKGTSQHGTRGDVIQEFDWSVGEVMATLERLKLTENTIVIVTGFREVWHHPELIASWKASLFAAHGNPAMMIVMALVLFLTTFGLVVLVRDRADAGRVELEAIEFDLLKSKSSGSRICSV